MKDHMRRQKEELEAKNAAARQQARMPGRPGPQGYGAPNREPPKPLVEKVADVSNLSAVWQASRNYLTNNARYLESVLGHCCSVASLNRDTGEAILKVSAAQRGFANEKARAKIEESLRAVTGLGIRLALEFAEEDPKAALEASRVMAPQGQAAQRVPAEVMEAIQSQKVVQELMKRLDATVVNVELLGSSDPE